MKYCIRICLIFLLITFLWAKADGPHPYGCGDINADEGVDIADAVYLLNHIFRGGPAPQFPDVAEVNNDGNVDIGDAVFLINYIFKSGADPICMQMIGAFGVFITDLPPDSILLDAHYLEAIEIESNTIQVTIGYSGGCDYHSFWLYMTPASFLESNPVQANLYLRHDSHGDPCDGWNTETSSFDLVPVGELYISQYGQPDTIIINVFDYFGEPPYDKLSAVYYPEL